MYSVLDNVTYLRDINLKPDIYINTLDLNLNENMTNEEIIKSIFEKFNHVVDNAIIDKDALYTFLESMEPLDNIIRLGSYGGIIVEWDKIPCSFINFHNGPKIYLQLNLSTVSHAFEAGCDFKVNDITNNILPERYDSTKNIGFFALGFITGVLMVSLKRR